jgi:hypothetical protein
MSTRKRSVVAYFRVLNLNLKEKEGATLDSLFRIARTILEIGVSIFNIYVSIQ